VLQLWDQSQVLSSTVSYRVIISCIGLVKGDIAYEFMRISAWRVCFSKHLFGPLPQY